MILGEFAIDPEVIVEWKDLNAIELCFGFENGAAISRYPKTWLSGIKEKAKKELAGTAKYSQVVEKLDNLKKFYLVNSGREYNPRKSWLENACAQRTVAAFHKIIALVPAENGPDIVDFGELDKNCFAGLREGSVKKNKEAFAEISALLLRNSKSIKFVDPFFSSRRGYLLSLIAMLQVAGMSERSNISRVEVHSSSIRDGSPVDIHAEKGWLDRFLAKKLAPGFEVIFYWWSDPNAKEIHPRYLLTDLGGIRFDRGFVQPEDHDERKGEMDVVMMKQDKVNLEWNRYRKEASVFKLATNGEHKVIGN